MKILICLFCLVALLPQFGCRKLLEVNPPDHQVAEKLVFATDETARAALNGLYGKMMAGTVLSNGALSLHGGLLADELLNTTANADLDAFRRNALLPTMASLNSRFWTHAYSTLHHANRVLEGLQSGQGLTESTRRLLMGEAYFFRAFYYDYLLQLYGPVPLVLGSDYRVNASLAREEAVALNARIWADLQAAEDLLPADFGGSERLRPSKWAARALKARVALRLGQWALAAAAATEVLVQPQYRLAGALPGVFSASSPETILQLKPVAANGCTAEALLFVPAGTSIRPPFVLTPALLSAFEPTDNRRTAWTKTVTLGGQVFTYPYKYKTLNLQTGPPEYNILLRLAEQLLIRVEARAHAGDLSGAKADLDAIRARAGLGASPALNQNDLLASIRQERRIEFFAELGFRWLDLKRLGLASVVLGPLKPDWQATDVLFPLPQTEIDRNPSLVQNPGY